MQSMAWRRDAGFEGPHLHVASTRGLRIKEFGRRGREVDTHRWQCSRLEKEPPPGPIAVSRGEEPRAPWGRSAVDQIGWGL